MNFDLNFQGKVAIITGASSGIGAATAKAFSQKGAKTALIDVKENEYVKKLGKESTFVKADVSNARQTEQAVAKTIQAFGKIDILVNCAGIEINDRRNLLEMPETDLERILKVDLYGYINMARASAKEMKTGGKIVNVSSTQAFGAHQPGTSYQIAKSGILGLTHVLALELAPLGINVNTIAPGAIKTEGMGGGNRVSKEMVGNYRKRILLGRRGKPEEVAGPILFMCSDLASYITGSTLIVDGGALINLTPDNLIPQRKITADDPDK